MSTELLERYRAAVHTWIPQARSGGVSLRQGGLELAAIEDEILAAAEPRDPSDRVDPIVMMALNLPEWIAVHAIERRREQLVGQTDGDEAFATWVIEGSKFAWERTQAIAQQRTLLLAALASIELATAQATQALDDLDHLLDLALITPQRRGSGTLFASIEMALMQVRIGYAAAQRFAPNPTTPERSLDHLED